MHVFKKTPPSLQQTFKKSTGNTGNRGGKPIITKLLVLVSKHIKTETLVETSSATLFQKKEKKTHKHRQLYYFLLSVQFPICIIFHKMVSP